MIDAELLEKARLYVRRWFARSMPPHMFFHDLEHTLSVSRSVIALGQAADLPAHHIAILEMAALFHDLGYAIKYEGHEAESVRIARAFLKKHKVSAEDIALVISLIKATEFNAAPATELEGIMKDADSAKAGQADFDVHSELLRRELGAVRGRRPSGKDWLRENIRYLQDHRFHSAVGRERYEEQKQINLVKLQKRLDRPGKKIRQQGRIAADRFLDRDLSWLSFNDRVLQEARDPRVPLLERIKFLAIYSSNLDEFYRVRVASLHSLIKLGRSYRTALGITPAKLVERINEQALRQQQEFGRLYRDTLLPALEKNGIRTLNNNKLHKEQRKFVRTYFKERIRPLITTAIARPGNAPFIGDRKLYFICSIRPAGKPSARERYALVNIPSAELGRFIVLPSAPDRTDILFIDDAVRIGLRSLFKGHRIGGCYSIKLTRDAELYLDEEFTGNVKEKVKKSLKKRHSGLPSRLLYEQRMPKRVLRSLREVLGLKKQELVPGGRYHNFSDLMQLPVKGHAELRDPEWPPLQHPALPEKAQILAELKKQDVLLHFPYHDFSTVIRLLRQAATDPAVQRISITLYRVAEVSAVCAALVDALHNGKDVTVFVEVQARFDERSNLFWGEALEDAGAQVIYSYENLKVHCKLCLIDRKERGRLVRYAYLGTGNFNEKTSRIYSDLALLTSDRKLCEEVAGIFAHLRDRSQRPALDRTLMAPLTLRSWLERMIDNEITAAFNGKRSEITIKVNSVEDRAIIGKLYDASRAGVKVRLIVRGICCLIPGVKGMSANIEVISIIDRCLEHARIYIFHNGGSPTVHLASADLMERNLDHRVEVAFPITDHRLKEQILHIVELQWNDRVKARRIDQDQTNAYLKADVDGSPIRAQEATYDLLKGTKR